MRNLRQQVEQPQSQDTTVIYGLVDPITGYVRYVGKSNNHKHRFKVHTTPRELRSKSHKNHWIKGLLALGQKPQMILLARVPNSEWEDAERKWIAYYRSIPGYPPLTNGTSGGDGVDKGTRPSEETRKKLSAIRTGKKLPPFTEEHRQKIANANKAYWYSLSEEQRQKRLVPMRLNPKPKKEKPPKIKKTHRVYPDKTKSSSRFRGVCFYGRAGKPWHAFCSLKGKLHNLGSFVVEEDAARQFDRFVIANGIEDAQLNFARSEYEDFIDTKEFIFKKRQYKGAYFHKSGKYWYSAINLEGKLKWIERCRSEIEAARSYDRKAIELLGADAILNFARSDYE